MSGGELIVKRSGIWIYFMLIDKIPISESRCRHAQALSGKHPDGYDFVNFKCEFNGESKMWEASWMCYDSCGS